MTYSALLPPSIPIRFIRGSGLLAVLLWLVCLGLGAVAQAAPSLPVGFVIETVVTGISKPTTIAWTPDGSRMFIAQKDGRVRVAVGGMLQSTDFINIVAEVNDNTDRGLIGIAVHPEFPVQPYVYLLYTYDPPGVAANGSGARVSRLLRVSANPSNLNIALPGSEVVLLGKTAPSRISAIPTATPGRLPARTTASLFKIAYLLIFISTRLGRSPSVSMDRSMWATVTVPP